ncbi:hypothetical protein CYLTODRAFT_416177 [Cylindrobasidium torrendii FP15055 ss-10]|uniref:Phosducin domain-containing protein n=1 Tax=Cylindrobasidium torrendii FP15055 ss-10 TaxID=1314674 RepID=A0A0D7BV05_9AGAR|nr:hypothetical protein CYLTODRAFT_416177 [Cylindrobasidium torrendii FP15055 ss-10]
MSENPQQYADLEKLILSGEFFNGKERSNSPVRTPSPGSEDHGWHDDEYDAKKATEPLDEAPQESIGMGPGRTGVKGVIRDRKEAQEIEKHKHAEEMDKLRQNMEKQNLGGKTYLEEEREKAARGEQKVDELVRREQQRVDVFGKAKQGPYGHLREVGREGYVQAVEKEKNGTWVAVHLYDRSLDRCYVLDDTLARLARANPSTKFLRCRASALGFARAAPSAPARSVTRPPRTIKEEDEDEDFDEKDDLDDEDFDVSDDDDVDLDMLPTMLVYRDGQLVHNWVRVDWEAGNAGVEELLRRHHILAEGHPSGRVDDDDGLFDSD